MMIPTVRIRFKLIYNQNRNYLLIIGVLLKIHKGGIHFTGLDDHYQQFAYMASEECIPPALKAGKMTYHEPLMFGG